MRSRPRLAVVALVGLSLAACGGGDDGRTGNDDRGSEGAAPTTTTTAAPAPADDATSSSGPSGAGVSTTRPTRTNRPPSTTAAPTGAAPSRAPAAEPAPGSGDVQPTSTDDGSQGPPGAFARTLLRPQPATAIVLERAAQAGATIGESAVSRGAGVLADVTGKPVDVRPQALVASSDTDWTADEVRLNADTAMATPQGDGRAVLRVLLLKGTFEGSNKVLGAAVRGDVLVLFVDSIARAATPLVSRAAIEDAVLVHELGHVLGLVDLARDTGRGDKEHPGHSTNEASVMFWAVESDLIGQVISGPPPRNFDAQDLGDLRALRNGA